MKFGYLKGVRSAILPPAQQADAVLSQANPVSTTLYTVLATTKNVRIIYLGLGVTWGVTQPTPLEMVLTVDGNVMTGVQANPVSGQIYSPFWERDSGNLQVSATDYLYLRGFILEGRSVKVEVRVTWAVTQPSPLVALVKWAKW